MAKKIMTCKAAPEIELQFDGGVSVLLRFDIRCLVNIQELEGGLKAFVKKGVADVAAGIVYAAGKDINDDFDEKKARAIVSEMSLENVLEIIKTFNESIGTVANGADEEELKKMVAQLLETKK